MNRPAVRRAARLFLSAVAREDWAEALNTTAVSYVREIPPEIEDREYLAAVFDGLQGMGGVAVGDAHHVRPSICDVSFAFTLRGEKVVGKCRLVRQDGRGKASPSGPGRWGVMPMSVLIGMRLAVEA